MTLPRRQATNPPPATGPQALARLRAGALAGSTRLDLRGCGLTELPPEVLALADTLETLDLSDNRLNHLPDAVAGLHRLQVLFCSGNRFTQMPAVLGRCPALDTVGFKANQIAHVPAQALAPTLRWLILTGNRISALPDTLGQCQRLQKLMLAGNHLQRLPASLGDCLNLELVRLSANRFATLQDALPAALLALPRLAWLAHAGNPFGQALEQAAAAQHRIDWAALQVQGLLGEGASGHIHAALWQRGTSAAPLPVAVKLFKGAITSDGLPASERAAGIAAGQHPQLVAALGSVHGHPAGAQGLVFRRIPPGYQNLAGPPSAASCTRDVYADGLRLSTTRATRIAQAMVSVLGHLHQQGLAHGDLYAHNILVDEQGDALLGDLGAASFLPPDDGPRREALQRIDRRALGVLIDELAARCDDPAALAAHGPVG